MKVIFYSLIIALFPTTLVSAQSPVQIKGKFKPTIENSSVIVFKPVSGVFNMALPDAKNETAVQNSLFKINVVIDQPGFIRLAGKDLAKTYFYAEPGGKVDITIVKDKTGSIRTTYSGANADANNLLAWNPPMATEKFLRYGLPELFKLTTAADFMTAIKLELATSTKPFNEMLAKKKITQKCYDAMMRESEQTAVHWINNYLKNFLMPDRELPQVSKFTRAEVTNLAKMLYAEYDPYDSRYRIATRTYNNQMIKSILVEDGVLADRTNAGSTWAPFANDFSMIVSRLSAIDHAPDSVQMEFMGMSLVSAIAFKPMTDDAFLKIFNVYYSKFPKSPFIPVITEQLSTELTEEKVVTEKPAADFYFLLNKNDSIKVSQSRLVDVKSIQELVKKEFAGKPVFVDFWATWCSPCIAEFQHEPGLKKFLEANNISTLYVSIDSENAIKKWQKAVTRYELNGFHYLATKEIRENLQQWFFGIPRYMLFDANGELKDDNLSRPSSKEELYQRISQLLGK